MNKSLKEFQMSAYLIFTHKVTDSDTLNNDYLPKAVETLQPYAPEILVVDQNIEVLEGNKDNNRTVVLKFKSREDALSWYNSPEYQAIINLRLNSGKGTAVLCDQFDPDNI